MTVRVVFEDVAEASLRRLLGDDPRYPAIRRAIADRAAFMVERVGRRCDAFPDRELWVDRPMAPPRLSLRVLIEVGEVRRIWSITAVDADADLEG